LGRRFQILFRFAGHPRFSLIHLVRWCFAAVRTGQNANAADWRRWSLTYWWWHQPFLAYQKARKKPIDLRELAAVFRAVGLDESVIGEHLLQVNRWASSPCSARIPTGSGLILRNARCCLRRLWVAASGRRTAAIYYREKEHRENAFGLLKLFPRLPGKFVPLLWELALGPGKAERALAQECLAGVSGKEVKIVAALAGRQQDARLAAAQWLAELDYREAIPALRAALSKEKSEVVKDELIRALETLGVNLEELVDLDALDKEAEKGLKKGAAGDLDWFPFGQLPAVRWAEAGKPVAPEIVKWFLVQGSRLGNAEASPTLRRYCSLFEKHDKEKLGRFVLEAWIAKDTKPKHTADEAAALAQKETQQAVALAKQYPNTIRISTSKSTISRVPSLLDSARRFANLDQRHPRRRGRMLRRRRRSHRASLHQAVVRVSPVAGEGASSGSGVGRSSGATQVVLAVANRFRTKGIQEEAMRQCQLLAERKGWTLDELADRTIPTAALDEGGVLELDYGTRVLRPRSRKKCRWCSPVPAEKPSLPCRIRTSRTTPRKPSRPRRSFPRRARN
jgi:hypothetical protein